MSATLTLLALVAFLVFACGDDTSTHANHAELGDAAPLEDDFHGCPPGFASSAPGLNATGERFAMNVVDAQPAEPERNLNDWTVGIRARTGALIADAELVRGETFMPVHGHDGRVRPRMTASSMPGEFRLERLNFTMRGPWEVRLWLRSGELAEDEVVFDVCVAK